MPVISITTDFGQRDGFVGTLKGVIWSICPQAQIADITHDVPPQDVMTGAIALWRAALVFPPGSVHIGVVDPGVGTRRRPMAARLGSQLYVMPDNGLLTPLIQVAEAAGWPVEFVELTNKDYWLPIISRTFHGRDIFAPVAAHLANGVSLEAFGPRFTDPTRLAMPKPDSIPGGWRAHVKVIDIFGNMTTDLHRNQVAELGAVTVRVLGREIDGLVPSYGHRGPGEVVALIDSEDYLEVAVVNGSAAKTLGGKVGDLVEVVRK